MLAWDGSSSGIFKGTLVARDYDGSGLPHGAARFLDLTILYSNSISSLHRLPWSTYPVTGSSNFPLQVSHNLSFFDKVTPEALNT